MNRCINDDVSVQQLKFIPLPDLPSPLERGPGGEVLLNRITEAQVCDATEGGENYKS
ncbi:MAG: hypothetical protein M3342_15170 [Bacteroidota bacterium]|nr:hypothetical protein [Flavisolibacter sp.]MDQ3845330.1 hypothetical protein [Bacteroidota bacterium]